MIQATESRNRWRRLSPEQRALVRVSEREGAIISRLRGIRGVERPKTGYWLMRAVKLGPEVPASIQWEQTEYEPGEPGNLMQRSPILTARIAGKIVALDRVWNWSKRAISRAEHDFRTADAVWAAVNAPTEPAANPHKKINYLTVPIPF